MDILVVDHSKVFRAMWRRRAQQAGHRTTMVAGGLPGLELLQRRPFDLICVSLTLPDIDGIDFCRQVRAIDGCGQVPLILMTSTEEQPMREAAFAAGVTDIHARSNIDDLLRHATRFLQVNLPPATARVLYIEDSPTVATAMLGILEAMEIAVDHFTSASEAFAVFDPDYYTLVISDILVEGEMSGIDLVSRIRRRCPESMRMPILAISGLEDDNQRMELFNLGINDFVNKPVLEAEVRARVTHLLSNRQLLEQVEEQRRNLYELAMTDQLTGLYNRNSLAEFSGRALAEANRHDFPLSVVLIDVDHFKRINDSHGHPVGDEVLAALGELLLTNCRIEDFAVRLGGEELMLILTHCGLEDATAHAERMRTTVEQARPAGLDVTVSLGVSTRPPATVADFDVLLRRADRAAYRAKANGRNRVETASDED